MNAVALTIAGSDPTGGSGIQQDLMTFAGASVHGLAVVTAITVQDAGGVRSVSPVAPADLQAQLRAVVALGFAAAKTGLLPTTAAVDAVATADVLGLVIDPVLIAGSGDRLAEPDVAPAIVAELLPRARLITPNAAEASVMTGIDVTDAISQLEAARTLASLGPAVLITGGHLGDGDVVDVLVDGDEVVEFRSGRLSGGSDVRGTGCRLSAGVTARLAQGAGLREAVGDAIGWVRAGIERAHKVGGVRVLGGFG